jgi:hypothetical protein
MVPWTLAQALGAWFIAGSSEAARQVTCDIEREPSYYTLPASVAFGGTLLALVLARRRPRLSLALSGVAAVISIGWAAAGGWSDFGCTYGI